ncbi:MAG: response regulator [Bacteroidota bacterium]
MASNAISAAMLDAELLVATASPAGQLTFRNPAWKTFFGTAADSWARLAERDAAEVRALIASATEGKLTSGHLTPVAQPSRDQPLYVLLHILPVQLEHTVVAVTITGEVLAEPASWTSNQTHRHRMETLGSMTMGIAHDFNNLLSGILGYTELLRTYDQFQAGDPSDHLATIEQAALDGAALVQRIQKYIRQEKLSHFEPIDLPTILEDSVSLTRPYWYNEPRRQGISIHVEQTLRPVPPILGSAPELREVFINFILNAVQAMPEGGTIAMLCDYRPEVGIEVTLSDTGVGMTDDVKERIFEPLFTTKGDRGTGMGLAVSYGIIQEHDGQITVDSTPGRGTRFHLIFPPSEVPLVATDADEVTEKARTFDILVVDDETMVRAVLAKLLGLRGHTIMQAASGAEALDLLASNTYDLVFTDHAMPEMSGTELARQIRTHYPHLPIVLLTGDTEVPNAHRVVDAHLSKPFKLEGLEAVIQELKAV